MTISVIDRVENIVGKEEIACTSNFSFSSNVFKRLLSQRRQKVSLCGNELAFPKQQILDPSKLKEFADNNFKFDENGRKLSKWLENTVGKGEIVHATSNFSFPHCVFERLVLQTRKNQGLFGKGLMHLQKVSTQISLQSTEANLGLNLLLMVCFLQVKGLAYLSRL